MHSVPVKRPEKNLVGTRVFSMTKNWLIAVIYLPKVQFGCGCVETRSKHVREHSLSVLKRAMRSKGSQEKTLANNGNFLLLSSSFSDMFFSNF